MAGVRLSERRNKYGNKRVKTAAGVSFDSKSEQRRWHELQLLERAGEIRDLTLHPRFRLEVNGHHIADYVADYSYQCQMRNPQGESFWLTITEDRKAGAITQTPVFQIKHKLLKAIYGIDILITGESS